MKNWFLFVARGIIGTWAGVRISAGVFGALVRLTGEGGDYRPGIRIFRWD